MAVYSISDLEKLSGIKAHTIRMWEKRYGIIQPKRTATNIRFYLDEDLKHILNVAILNRNGFKISHIANFTKEEIERKAEEFTNVTFSQDNVVDSLTLALIELDELKFSRIIDTNIDQNGFEETMSKVVYPLISKLTMLWMTGSIKPVHENFMTLVIRQKIIAEIENVQGDTEVEAPKFLLFLPPGETQELSLLYLHYLIVSRGNRAINLGLEIGLDDLKDATEIQHPEFLITIISENEQMRLQEFINTLSNTFPDTQILISGYQVVAQNAQPPANVRVAGSLDEIVQNFTTTLHQELNG